jgi:rare lipoprotein A
MHIKIIAFLLLSQTLLFAQTVGLASWYGEKFQGRTTSSGEIFNMYDYTAAHKTLPFGTIVTVTNLKNGKSINVKVNDRGPYKSNRIMDLSFQAAQAIGLVNMGTTTVSIVRKNSNVINTPVTTGTGLTIHTASKEDLASMMEYALRVTDSNKNITQPIVSNVKKNSSLNIKVQIASFATKKGAEEFMFKQRNTGYKMEIVSLYISVSKPVRHKVVILTNSKTSAVSIVNSKKYNGAYILR